MSNIIEFVSKTLTSYRSRAKYFESLQKLVDNARQETTPHKTKPGEVSLHVAQTNTGETAFQRAIYGAQTCSLGEHEVRWQDIELPVTFSGSGRRRCIDLIGHASFGSFICELKYAAKRPPATLKVDYAILQALIYYGIVSAGPEKLKGVGRDATDGGADWTSVAKSRKVVVAANTLYWTRAQAEDSKVRIRKLTTDILSQCEVEVLLFEVPCSVIFSPCLTSARAEKIPSLDFANGEPNRWRPALL